MDIQVYVAQIDPSLDSNLGVSFIALVEQPAIEKNFMAFKKQESIKLMFNEEKRIISGPAMIADMPIYRKDDQLGEYYIIFGKEAIAQIVEKFSSQGLMKNFNLFHDEKKQCSGVVIFNSFISNKDLGIQPLSGFEDIADGSWFISAKVNNDEIWKQVKDGTFKGFSVEGLFNFAPLPKKEKMSQEEAYEKILNILNETDF
jgi:hypothetical protein